MAPTIVYWISTCLLSAIYLLSATIYIRTPEVAKTGHTQLGYVAPNLIPFMIVIKILAPIAIISRVSVGLSDLAYAGLFYHLIISGLAHYGVRNAKGMMPAIIGMILLLLSFATQNAARLTQSPYKPHLPF